MAGSQGKKGVYSSAGTSPRHQAISKITAETVAEQLKALADPKKAAFFPTFFKTGPGEYGEGDVFIGVTVPAQREVSKACESITLSQVQKLLSSKIHEHRLTALLILVRKFSNAKSRTERSAYVEFYLANRARINNWDLVDASARYILGEWLLDKPDTDCAILYDLAVSDKLWDRRIAIVATHAFIMKKRFEHTLRISEILINDKQDLMHKAVGWMLREMGKQDEKVLRAFLDKHAHHLPRTALRYSLERFDAVSRKKYMGAGVISR